MVYLFFTHTGIKINEVSDYWVSFDVPNNPNNIDDLQISYEGDTDNYDISVNGKTETINASKMVDYIIDKMGLK